MKLCKLTSNQQPYFLNCGALSLDLSKPHVMGILNVTPDSFSDGGSYLTEEKLLARVQTMLDEGATLIDIGGESTRPNAPIVSEVEELARVIPAVEAIVKHFNCVISIDTSSPEVMRQAHQAGAHIWNDVRALKRVGALEMAVQLNIPVILMHSRGEPDTMNQLTDYANITADVMAELNTRIDLAIEAGVDPKNIILDVGFGFAKNTDQNLELLDNLWQFKTLNYPLMIGLSRKRFLGEVIAPNQTTSAESRIYAGISAGQIAIQQGVCIIRTHDVGGTVHMIRLQQRMSIQS